MAEKMTENEIKNNMKQLAKSFGVKLGEEVMLTIGYSKEPIKCRILEDRIEGIMSSHVQKANGVLLQGHLVHKRMRGNKYGRE